MDVAAVVAVLTTIFSVAVKVVGMPAQIKRNYRHKSTAGLSTWFMISTLISYALWVVHGFEVHDMSLVIGQGLGVIVTGLIIVQMFKYRNAPVAKKSDVERAKPSLLWFTAMQTAVFRKSAKRERLL